METQALMRKMMSGAHLTPEEQNLLRAYYEAKSLISQTEASATAKDE